MKLPALGLALLLASVLPVSLTLAAEGARSSMQTGKMSTVRLLATARLTKPSPDGVRFLFLVTPTSGTPGNFALKETRDFLLDGKSYREMTKAETGKEWEPETEFYGAEGFFAKQPGMRRLAPEGDLTGANILVMAIGGAALPARAAGEITLRVGFEKEVEPFTFAFQVPPGSAPPAMTGAPRVPGEGVTRYVATEGVGFAPWTFDLKINNGAVAGAVYQHRSDASGASTGTVGPFEIFEGRHEGSRLSFKAGTPGGERVALFQGELAGDVIRFTRTLELKPGMNPGQNGILGARGATEFVARKAGP
jgi:hypothetical protein